MVGKGPERPEPPASATGRGGSIIPAQPLWRALLDSMQKLQWALLLRLGEVGGGRRRLVEVDVAAGEVGRLLRLPRRHPQLIHPTTGLLRLTWTRLGLRSMSLRSLILRPTRLGSPILRPT